ncbi:uncharacterized protein DS421_11g331070 [Arachis hypogaea]|nr:uncharacterized protein DS421_11g331070 [Arachis hypogaea]
MEMFRSMQKMLQRFDSRMDSFENHAPNWNDHGSLGLHHASGSLLGNQSASEQWWKLELSIFRGGLDRTNGAILLASRSAGGGMAHFCHIRDGREGVHMVLVVGGNCAGASMAALSA